MKLLHRFSFHYLISFFSIISCVSLVCLGFFLPRILAHYEDDQLLSEIAQYNLTQNKFSTDSSLVKVLNLVAHEYYWVDVDEETTEHTAEQIHTSALELLNLLSSYGLSTIDSTSITTHSEVPFMAVIGHTSNEASSAVSSSTDVELSSSINEKDSESVLAAALLWECSIQNKTGDNMTILFDDKSGKMVAFSYVSSSSIPSDLSQKIKYSIVPTNSLIPFCEKYYGYTYVRSITAFSEQFSDKSTLILQFVDEKKEGKVHFNLTAFHSNISFNFNNYDAK